MRKIFCLSVLTLAVALSAGCQHLYDAYTEQEEAALEDGAAALVRDYLERDWPGAEITYVSAETVTDYHLIWQTGYVNVTCAGDGEERDMLVDVPGAVLYTPADLDGAAEVYARRLLENLGLPAEGVEVEDGHVELYLPITYDNAKNPCKFMELPQPRSVAPVTEPDPVAWLLREPDRPSLFCGGSIRLPAGAGLGEITFDRFMRAGGAHAGDIFGFDLQSGPDEYFWSGGDALYYTRYAREALGDFVVRYPAEKRTETAAGRESERCVLADNMEIVREPEGFALRFFQPDSIFTAELYAQPGAQPPELILGQDGTEEALQWLPDETGALQLCDSNGGACCLWEDCRLRLAGQEQSVRAA
jgi:hypothetical protein